MLIGRITPAALALAALIVIVSGCSENADATTTAAPAPSTSSTTNPSPDEPTTTTPPTTATETTVPDAPFEWTMAVFPVPAGSRPHDVAPAVDGGVWYTAQGSGELGWLDPETGATHHIPLGGGSQPHGVIVGPDGAPWITDSGLNAIVRVDPVTNDRTIFPLPPERPNANLNTAAFDGDGRIWFTGQNGIHGVLDPATGTMEVFDSPRGRGPYGIAATPEGEIYYASLAGSYVGQVAADGSVTVLEPPTPDQGARRVWSDSTGSIWVSEWNSGQLSRYEPDTGVWTTWQLPGPVVPHAYAVYVDEADIVWVSDFGRNAVHRFDPTTEEFVTIAMPSTPGNVRQILGRPGEVWLPLSASDELAVILHPAS